MVDRSEMLDIAIGRNKRNILAQNALLELMRAADLTGTLYFGYPILASADQMVAIDALLTTSEHGLVAINFLDAGGTASPEQIRERQDDMYNAVYRKLLDYKPLVDRRKLSVPINVLTFAPTDVAFAPDDDLIVADPQTVIAALNAFEPVTQAQLGLINAAVQRVTTMKPPIRREVQRANSRGGIIKSLDDKIANLDQWQKKAAIESPDGPQRIRGLAGSGKTIVLALKAAYLHASNPEWDIAVTFNSRALYQRFKDLIRRFCFEHTNDEPDWNKLRILHAWGSSRQPGIYSEIAIVNNLGVRDLSYAKSKYATENVFGGICDELLAEVKAKGSAVELFDAILIDEAQDLPRSFFELCYLSAREPARIVWAYDELQNLGSYSMAPPEELFGSNPDGQPRVATLNVPDGTPKRDIILPICYRNTPWALTAAHAVGFGIYRESGLVQFFDNPTLWGEVGYEVVNGEFSPGKQVSLKRGDHSYPSYFADLLTPQDSIQWNQFTSPDLQAEWVAKQIETNLTEDELKHTDILIIVPDAISSKTVAARMIEALDKYAIPAHLAGVNTSVDRLYQEQSVAISSIYRAKGNEAAMVYILNSEYAIQPFQGVRARNILFTAMTRSRAWVRVCGCGDRMAALAAELQMVVTNHFELRFNVPTPKELEKIRRIHRDMSDAELAKRKSVLQGAEQFLEMVESGELPPEALPERFRRRLASVFGEADDNS
jgi:superfamily I DNA and RNA helicase